LRLEEIYGVSIPHAGDQSETVGDSPCEPDQRGVRSDRVVFTFPIHNEGKLLGDAVDQIYSCLGSAYGSLTVSIAEDGSTDQTARILETVKRKHPDIVVKSNKQRLGRGLALRRLWEELDGDVFVFADVDLPSGVGSIVQVIEAVRARHDVVVASRYCEGASVNRPPLRTFVSRKYNALIRYATSESIQDYQCGLKGFSRAAIRTLLPLTREDTWFWDTEILVIATRMGYKVEELPVRWVEPRRYRTSLRRLASDTFIHGTGLIKLASRINNFHAVNSTVPESESNMQTAHSAEPFHGTSGKLMESKLGVTIEPEVEELV